jgi:hypothetical protein
MEKCKGTFLEMLRPSHFRCVPESGLSNFGTQYVLTEGVEINSLQLALRKLNVKINTENVRELFQFLFWVDDSYGADDIFTRSVSRTQGIPTV